MNIWLWIVLFIGSSYVSAVDDFIPIDLEGNHEDFGIYIVANTIGNVAMIELENISGDVIGCTGVFSYGPELPVTRRAVLKPRVKKMMKARLFREVIRLNIKVDCEESS